MSHEENPRKRKLSELTEAFDDDDTLEHVHKKPRLEDDLKNIELNWLHDDAMEEEGNKELIIQNVVELMQANIPELVNLSNNQELINDARLKKICEALKTNTSVKTLNLSFAYSLSRNGVMFLIEALEDNRTLETLIISDIMQENDVEMATVIPLLANDTLTHLDISHDEIWANNGEEYCLGKLGANILQAVLTKNKTLKKLDISGNNFKDDGIKYIANGLSKNTTLESIDLNNNEMTDKGIDYLMDMLKVNSALMIIVLEPRCNPKCSAEKIKELQDVMACRRELKQRMRQTLSIASKNAGFFKENRDTVINIASVADSQKVTEENREVFKSLPKNT